MENTYRVTCGRGELLASLGCLDCAEGRSTCDCVLMALSEARQHGNGTTVLRGGTPLAQVWSKSYGDSPVLSAWRRERRQRMAARKSA